VAHLRQASCKFARSTARCVDLAVVCVVNDLPLRNELCGCFGEFLKQNDRQRKIAASKDSTVLFAGDRVDLREIAIA
jgi:hypothetical protein